MFNKLKTKRVLERLKKYAKNATSKYDSLKKEQSACKGDLEYQHGLTLGYRYALEQVEREDVSVDEKTELLKEYKSIVGEGGIRRVYKDMTEGKKDVDGHDKCGADNEIVKEKFKEGFTHAMDHSYRLYRDALNYMSFRELFFSKR